MDTKPDTQQAQHGGNVSSIACLYPDAPRPLIDLSTGINPYPYPLPPLHPEQLHRLADTSDVQKAIDAAAQHYSAPTDTITLAPGMQSLMFALAALRLKEHGASIIAIPSPTYAEHARIWQTMGHTITDGMEGDVVILCNPNNPDGRTITPQELTTLAEKLDKRGGWMIVDESFADMVHGISMIREVGSRPNLAVLRSCGKTYGMAGLRLSFAITSHRWTEFLRVAMGPWPISTYACKALPTMLGDTTWLTAMREQLETEALHWRELLARYFTIIGHTALFTLVETENATEWAAHLASQGILVRTFDYNPHWIRFGLPESKHLARLTNTLTRFGKP